jgi:hypothetical protein
VGLPAYVLVKVLTPNFFARKDTRTPVYTAAPLVINVGLNFVLVPRWAWSAWRWRGAGPGQYRAALCDAGAARVLSACPPAWWAGSGGSRWRRRDGRGAVGADAGDRPHGSTGRFHRAWPLVGAIMGVVPCHLWRGDRRWGCSTRRHPAPNAPPE